jgi:hypothetical protein
MVETNGGDMDAEDLMVFRLWATGIVCAFVLALAVAGCLHYETNILPLRMAEKGYCHVPYPTGAATTKWIWQPCPGLPKVER